MIGILLGQYLAVIVMLVTSIVALWIGLARFGLGGRGLRLAVLQLLDGVWMVMVFFAANVLLGVGLIAAGKALGAGPLSSYGPNDLALGAVSLVQGVAFQIWRSTGRAGQRTVRRRRRSPPARPG